MKTFLLTLGFASTLVASQALAGGAPAPLPGDTNGNGSFSLAEIAALHPGVTQAVFNAADKNHDGALSEAEVKIAQQKGEIPS